MRVGSTRHDGVAAVDQVPRPQQAPEWAAINDRLARASAGTGYQEP